MTKLIYLGCLSSINYKSTCKNAIKLINYIDKDFKVYNEVPCCGSLAFHISSEEELKNHINFVNNWFKKNNIRKIITICAGCYNYLSRYYPEYLGSQFDIEVKHLLQFLAEPESLEKLNLKYTGKKLNINYHDACHLRNALKPIIEEPRIILNSIKNVSFNEMDYNRTNSICCGAGGGVYSIFKENSDFNAKAIFDNMKKGNILLTACPFCYTALKRIKEENNIKKPIIKFEDFIVNLMEGVDPIN